MVCFTVFSLSGLTPMLTPLPQGIGQRLSATYVSYLTLTIYSLERVEQYRNIEHESPPLPSGIPPAFWPASGHLRAENLSARYSEVSMDFSSSFGRLYDVSWMQSGPRVLHDVSFEIKSGERVGIGENTILVYE